MASNTVTLNSGHQMPVVGFGTWQCEPEEVEQAVFEALKCGYRLLDCAYAYDNETGVGRAIKQAIDQGILKREDLFITTKLWNTFHAPDDVVPALKTSLQRLGVGYVDLYLIHFPHAFKGGCGDFPLDAEGVPLYVDIHYMDTWKGMEQCVEQGLARSIGVSNFNPKQMQELIENCTIKPANHQIEVHPYLNNKEMVALCHKNNISVTAYSPLASGALGSKGVGLLHDPVLLKLSQKYNRPVSQVIFRWLMQRSICIIPKSVTPARIQENFQVFDIELTLKDMETVDSLNEDLRLVVPFVTINGKKVYRDRNAPNFPFSEPMYLL